MRWPGVVALIALTSCGDSGVVVRSTPAASPPPASTLAPPTVVASPAPAGNGREVAFLRDGVVVVKNTSGQTQTYYGCSMRRDFSLIAAISATVADGDTVRLQMNGRCSQNDLTHERCPNFSTVLAVAYYDADGVPRDHAAQVNWAACAPQPTPTPRSTPSPSPKPSPTPCPKCKKKGCQHAPS